ncbi:SCO-spondin-like isoform X2 [Actinia tenebrosa]|uniref:SCO-spondin-like isoform X2 n=1 Tax=Actinia tenebrosa TaxID=6105 RepID=A0A6P8IIB7_ACTTE|nr:SCO-spondin-like isoform X2 [Actinia tenebrosa]XP_031566548.1 SCO-spondin-like isoform X2 [Actinia tenebrosa]XP_031566549.1 SCO-spondin-like isoform X2 [Actinia tenebrosa]
MSQITLDPTDMPHLRIDGALVNLTTALGKQLSIYNKTAFLKIQKQSDEKNEGEVVFFSLEYKTGVTVTIYVRHSDTMGRQFLNVLYTLTADFKGRTQGICGLMDNNPANDLTGPNGELYTDPVKFADSWRILATNNQSGLYDSWSWNSSNFHADDVMDSTYTDPSHVPMYGLSNVSSDLLKKSRQTCLARKLPDNLLKSCIYDVAVTNDTSFAMQEVLLTGCPDQCSGKGRCVNQTCECLKGWTGEKCEIGTCPNCSTSNGKCIKGFCQCSVGWQGDTCSEKATCYDVNN